MIAGTSASITRPVRHTRQCGWRRCASASTRWDGANPVVSSSAPSIDGTLARAQSAPSPQADACTSPSAGRERSRRDAVPSGVRRPRQIEPSGSVRNVGSARPLRRIDSVVPVAQGHDGRHTRSDSVTAREYVGAVGHNEAVLLADLVRASAAVGATRSRKAKTAALAAALAEAAPDEVLTATSYLSGVLRQRRTGLGWRGHDGPAPGRPRRPR